jgi:tRNA(Ile)-lysidine synthase
MRSAVELIKSQKLLSTTEKTLIGVSGGRDSVALTHFLHKHGFQIAIAHVNYQLRGRDSNSDEELVKTIATQLDVPCFVKRVKKDHALNTQIWARNVRYNFYSELCEKHGFHKIATGHHAEDAIETVLINLFRGTGIIGLAGIPHTRANIVRPLLNTTRKEIDAYIESNKLSFREDATNSSVFYFRNLIRNTILPIVKRHDENIVSKLKASKNNLYHDAVALQKISAHFIDSTNGNTRIDLSKIPTGIRETILYHAIAKFGFNRNQCFNITKGKSGALIESEHYKAVKKGLQINILPKNSALINISITSDGLYKEGQRSLNVARHTYIQDKLPLNKEHVWIDDESVSFPLLWKTIEPRMKFKPLGSEYEVNIDQYLKNQGIDRESRKRLSVITDSTGRIIWIPAIQIAEHAKCTYTTQYVISLNYSVTYP